VPIEFFIDAQHQGYSRQLRFLLLLKLVYPHGKTKFSTSDLQFLELLDGITRKTTLGYLEFLAEKEWITLNVKTGYYLIKALDKIRIENQWNIRLAFPVNHSNYHLIKAVTGAVFYSYLHKGFWRQLAKRKSVQIMGSTYHFPHVRFNYKRKPAPVSVSWIQNYFKIPRATASELKKAAFKAGLIDVSKNYGKIVTNKSAMMKSLKYNDSRFNIVWHNGNYHFQLIDTIFPLFYFTKRKSIEP